MIKLVNGRPEKLTEVDKQVTFAEQTNEDASPVILINKFNVDPEEVDEFISDRSISEKDFGIIQKDRVSEMNNWANEIKNIEEGKERGRSSEEVSAAMIAANNHYAGFGPGTVNIFRTMVGQTELSWQDQAQLEKQMRHQKELEKNQQMSTPNFFKKQSKKRQTSLTEFTK